MNRLAGVFACCVAMGTAWCDVVNDAHRVAWRADVAEGGYADAASWADGITPMDTAKYGLIDFRSRDVTVTVPPEGLSESTGTIFLGTGSGTHTLTIDTRGGVVGETGGCRGAALVGISICAESDGFAHLQLRESSHDGE